MQASPAAVSRDRLEYALWGDDPPDGDMLRSHVYELRRSVDAPFETRLIQTLPRVGYRLAAVMRKRRTMRRTGLRLRITALVVAYMLALSLAVIYHGNVVNERAEKLVWTSLLQTELDHYLRRAAEDPDYRWRDTEDRSE